MPHGCLETKIENVIFFGYNKHNNMDDDYIFVQQFFSSVSVSCSESKNANDKKIHTNDVDKIN